MLSSAWIFKGTEKNMKSILYIWDSRHGILGCPYILNRCMGNMFNFFTQCYAVLWSVTGRGVLIHIRSSANIRCPYLHHKEFSLHSKVIRGAMTFILNRGSSSWCAWITATCSLCALDSAHSSGFRYAVIIILMKVGRNELNKWHFPCVTVWKITFGD